MSEKDEAAVLTRTVPRWGQNPVTSSAVGRMVDSNTHRLGDTKGEAHHGLSPGVTVSVFLLD